MTQKKINEIKDPTRLYNLGLNCYSSGDLSKAIAYCEKALALRILGGKKRA